MVANHRKTIVTNGWLTQNHRYQWLADPKPSKNHCFQWLPLTIPFNGDGANENHCKFSMVAKMDLKVLQLQQTTLNIRKQLFNCTVLKQIRR